VCFDISSDESQIILVLFVIVFMWDDQLRSLLIVNPIYIAFSVVMRVVARSVYGKITGFFFLCILRTSHLSG